MNLFVCGLRRSGTTIVYDALSEDPELRCFYEPLREDSETIGGGSGAHQIDLSAETRELREAFRRDHYPELQIELFNWGGPRVAEIELEPGLPEHVRGLLAHLLELAPDVAIKETRLHHKLGAVAEVDPDAAVLHLVRDPRAVTASMLLGRRRRTDIYPDAETFFTARTGRRLWSSRRISEDLVARRRSSLDLPADIPDFLRPLLVWKSAFETMAGDGPRLFGDRYALLRLEDLRTDPGAGLELIYGLIGGTPPDRVTEWVAANLRRDSEIHLRDDPRWARAARLLKMEPELKAAGYGEILELEPAPGEPLNLTPPAARSRLAGFMGRARRRQRTE
jgi:Sulfotransferase family